MSERGLKPGGIWSRLVGSFTRPKTPRWTIVELEKPVPVLEHTDDAAILSLKGHPGITALLNRLRLQRAVLESQLLTRHFKDLNDVNFLQSGISWSRIFESEIRNATKNLEMKEQRPAADFEIEQFEEIKKAIESIGSTRS
jgi:hypothetical protein